MVELEPSTQNISNIDAIETVHISKGQERVALLIRKINLVGYYSNCDIKVEIDSLNVGMR